MVGRVLLATWLTVGIGATDTTVEPRFESIQVTSDDLVVAWVTADGNRLAFGSGTQVRLTTSSPSATTHTLELHKPITDAVLVDHRLYVVVEGNRLARLGPGRSPVVETVELFPPPQGRLLLSRMDDYLLVAEDDYGIRILELPGHHGGTSEFPTPTGVLAHTERFRAIAASGRTVFAAIESADLIVVDAKVPSTPVLSRRVPLDTPVEALSADDTRVYLLGRNEMGIIDLSNATPAQTKGTLPLSGRDFVRRGRSYVVASERGVVAYRDRSQGAQLHTVTLGNNFFSPNMLTIDVGDEVRWTNAVGFHNVFSCTTSQSGCDGIPSSEVFTNGSPGTFWAYNHTFIQSGPNPYVCQPHAPFMAGHVEVMAPVTTPPSVPDGTGGNPMTAGKLAIDGSSLSVSWDTAVCPGVADHQIVYGSDQHLPTARQGLFDTGGGVCSLGTTSPFSWTGVPDPTLVPGGLLWWVVVANDGSTTEGSWSTDSDGVERVGPGPDGSSGECGVTLKDTSNTCGE